MVIKVPTYSNGKQEPSSIHIDVYGFIRVLAEDVGDSNEQHISVTVSMTYTKRFQDGVGIENQTAYLTQATKKAVYKNNSANAKVIKTKGFLEKFKEVLEDKNISRSKPLMGWFSRYYQNIFNDLVGEEGGLR